MTTKDGCALAMAISGILCIAVIYIVYWRGRIDIYEGDRERSKSALIIGTVAIQAFLLSLACWGYCLIDGIA